MNFNEMPWLVTVTNGEHSETYGPSTMGQAVELREGLRVAAPGCTIEAWAAQSPDPRVIKPPEQAWEDACR